MLTWIFIKSKVRVEFEAREPHGTDELVSRGGHLFSWEGVTKAWFPGADWWMPGVPPSPPSTLLILLTLFFSS